jgi:S1-C subfamily serine protease
MKAGVLCVLIPFLILAPYPAAAGARESPPVCPLPAAEAAEVVSLWLAGSGFSVRKALPESGRVRLEAQRGDERWHVVVTPRSPLASEVAAEYVRDGRPDPGRVAGLRVHLDDYVRSMSAGPEAAGREVPAAVLAQVPAAVCIRAEGGDGPIRFSGFLVGTGKLVLSTAHDLEGAREMTVTFSDGRECPGRLVRRDPARDLALIGIGGAAAPRPPPSGVREALETGERIYAIGCSGGSRGTVRNGVVDGPPRRSNGLPLWQVAMETLPGSSGGPAFDARGNFVGVVKGRYRGTVSQGFLIPAGTVLEFLEER